MKNTKNLSLIGAGVATAAAVTFGFAGTAAAQDDAPAEDPAPAEETETVKDRSSKFRRANARGAAVSTDGTPSAEDQEARAERKAEKLAAIAEVLDIAVEELQTAREAGTPLADIAGDQLPELVDLFTDRATERIAAKVESGRITQEQADEKLSGLDERVQNRLENGKGKKNKGNKRAAAELSVS